jgi:hypothetical protein
MRVTRWLKSDGCTGEKEREREKEKKGGSMSG